MVTINISNKLFYILIVITGLLLLGVSVVAFGTSGPASVFGHSGGEIDVTFADGTTQTLDTALADIKASQEAQLTELNVLKEGQRKVMHFTVMHPPGTPGRPCVKKNIEELCGDADGCYIMLQFQHLLSSDDHLNLHRDHFYFEQADRTSSNNPDTTTVTVRSGGGGSSTWQMGNPNLRYSLTHPWDLVWMNNYDDQNCVGRTSNSEAFTNPYEFTWMSRGSVRTDVWVYDN